MHSKSETLEYSTIEFNSENTYVQCLYYHTSQLINMENVSKLTEYNSQFCELSEQIIFSLNICVYNVFLKSWNITWVRLQKDLVLLKIWVLDSPLALSATTHESKVLGTIIDLNVT